MADGDELNIPSGTATMLDTDNTPVFVPLDRVQEQVGKGYQRGTYMTDKDNNTVIVGHNRLAEAYKKGYKVGPASQADVGAPPKPGLYTKLAMNVLGAPFGQQPTPLSAKDFQQGWQDTKTAASETGRIGLGVAKSMAPPISPPAVPPELRDKMPEWYNTLSDAGIGAPAAGQSMGQGMIQAGKQSVEQFKKKQYVRAGVSGAAALDPFAGGPVSQVNQLEESGQGDEAAVRGGVDALALGLGGKLQEGGLKAIADKINKPNMPAVHEALSSLIDTKAGKVNPFRTAQATADAIRNEAAKQGIRKSQFKGREGNELGAKIVDDTINSHNAEVKGLAQPLMKDTVDLRPIAKAIRDEITDEMRNNAPALAKRLETEAASFDRNGTLQEVDDFRTRKNGDLGSYYKKGQTEQIASDKEAGAADAGVRAARQIEYDHIGNRSGVDPAYIKGLADKETDLINVRNDINKRVNEASSQQSKAKAQGFFEEVFGTKGKADIADVKSGIFKSLLGAKPVDVLNNRFKTIYGKNFNVTPTVQPPAPGGVPPLGPNRPALPAGQYPAGASSLFEGQKQLPAATDTTLHQPPIDQPGQLVNAVRMSGRDVSTGRFKQAFGTSPQEAIAYKPISQFPGVMRSIDAAMKAKGTSPKVQAAVIEDLRRAMEQKYQQTVPSPQQTPPTAPAGQPFDPNTWTTPPGFTSDAKPLSGPNLLSSSLDRTGNTDLSARAGEAAKRVIAEDQAKPTSEQIAERLRQLNPEGIRGQHRTAEPELKPRPFKDIQQSEHAPRGLGIPDDLWIRLTPEGKQMWAEAAQNAVADKLARQAQWRRDAGLMGRIQPSEGVQGAPEGTPGQNALVEAQGQVGAAEEFPNQQIAKASETGKAPSANIPLGKTTEDVWKNSETGEWKPEREAWHQSIADNIIAGKKAATDRKPVATIVGGGTATGKSTISNRLMNENPNLVHIDADAIKPQIPEYDALRKQEGDQPKETAKRNPNLAASRVHEESSYIAKLAMAKGIANKLDLIYDATSSGKGLPAMVDKLKSEGYDIKLMFTDVPEKLAIERAADRATNSQSEADRRYIPSEAMHNSHTLSAKNFLQLKDSPDIKSMTLYDTTDKPKVVYSGGGGSGVVLDKAKWQSYQDKANTAPVDSFTPKSQMIYNAERPVSPGSKPIAQLQQEKNEIIQKAEATFNEAVKKASAARDAYYNNPSLSDSSLREKYHAAADEVQRIITKSVNDVREIEEQLRNSNPTIGSVKKLSSGKVVVYLPEESMQAVQMAEDPYSYDSELNGISMAKSNIERAIRGLDNTDIDSTTRNGLKKLLQTGADKAGPEGVVVLGNRGHGLNMMVGVLREELTHGWQRVVGHGFVEKMFSPKVNDAVYARLPREALSYLDQNGYNIENKIQSIHEAAAKIAGGVMNIDPEKGADFMDFYFNKIVESGNGDVIKNLDNITAATKKVRDKYVELDKTIRDMEARRQGSTQGTTGATATPKNRKIINKKTPSGMPPDIRQKIGLGDGA